MLRITTSENQGSIVFAMEGRLCGDWANEARRAWQQLRSNSNSHPIILELSGVTFVDKLGEALLAEILSSGAQAHSNGVLIGEIVDRVQKQKRTKP